MVHHSQQTVQLLALASFALGFSAPTTNLPATKMPSWVNETSICAGGRCIKPAMKYERIIPDQPGFQWDDAGGYCVFRFGPGSLDEQTRICYSHMRSA